MNLSAARADGIDFFTFKATESTNVRHRHYAQAMYEARAAGIPVLGAYHVVRSTTPVAAQVAYFLRYLDEVTPWWRSHPCFFLQADLERWSYDSVSPSTGSAFNFALKAAQPKRVITYASRGQYGDGLSGIGTPLWNANYMVSASYPYRDGYTRSGGDGGPGWRAYSGQVPVLWQYTSNASIGSQHTCDANAFRGTLAQLKSLIGSTASPITAEEIEHMLVLVRKAGEDRQVWLADGVLRTKVADSSIVAVKQVAHLLGDVLANGGNVYDGTTDIDAWGTVYPPAAVPVTLTDADRAAIAAAVLAELGPKIAEIVVDALATSRHITADAARAGADRLDPPVAP